MPKLLLVLLSILAVRVSASDSAVPHCRDIDYFRPGETLYFHEVTIPLTLQLSLYDSGRVYVALSKKGRVYKAQGSYLLNRISVVDKDFEIKGSLVRTFPKYGNADSTLTLKVEFREGKKFSRSDLSLVDVDSEVPFEVSHRKNRLLGYFPNFNPTQWGKDGLLINEFFKKIWTEFSSAGKQTTFVSSTVDFINTRFISVTIFTFEPIDYKNYDLIPHHCVIDRERHLRLNLADILDTNESFRRLAWNQLKTELDRTSPGLTEGLIGPEEFPMGWFQNFSVNCQGIEISLPCGVIGPYSRSFLIPWTEASSYYKL